MKNFNLKGVLFAALLIGSFCFTQNVAAQCTYDPGFTLPLGKITTTPPAMARPNRGAWYKDGITGACVVRLTNSALDGEYVFARPDYSRRQAFNIDNTKVIVGMDGHGNYFLYDATTVSFITLLWSFSGPSQGPAGDAECIWSATSPDTMYFMNNTGGLCIYKVNVNTKVSSYAARFTAVKGIAGYPGATSILSIWPSATRCWTRAEGSPSADGRYWGYQVENGSYTTLGFMVYDMQTDSIIGVKNFSGGRPDHCSMSPSGRWFVVSGTDVRAYPRDLSGDGYFILGNSEHSDMALNEKGEDIYCYCHYGNYEPAISYGKVGARNLDTHEYFDICDLYGANKTSCSHLSGRAFQKPGWIVISTASGDATWNNNKISAFELKPNGRIVNIACQYNNVSTYFTETHGTVSRDFTHLLWASTFGASGEANIEAAMCVLPTTAVPDIATEITSPRKGQTVTSKISINSSAATIKYTVEIASTVQVTLFNHLGQTITALVNEKKAAGTYSAKWNGMNSANKLVPSGIYFCQITIGDKVACGKLMLMR